MTDSDVSVAIAAAAAAAAIIRREANQPIQRFEKTGGDFATQADLAAEEAIVAILRSARPLDSIIGEETGHHAGASTARTWLVDPLCGTANFAVDFRHVAVNVALAGQGGVEVAAVADPFLGELFWADRHGAGMRTAEGDRPLVPNARSRIVDVNLDPPFPSEPARRVRALPSLDKFIAAFRPRVVSTSLALAWVASGRRAAYVTDGATSQNEHFAAGAAVCLAAGCIVRDFDGRPWPSGGLGLIAAADAETHAALLELIDQTA
jgi:myo-inositol-1(or 4)-monophosphatase